MVYPVLSEYIGVMCDTCTCTCTCTCIYTCTCTRYMYMYLGLRWCDDEKEEGGVLVFSNSHTLHTRLTDCRKQETTPTASSASSRLH